MNMKITVTGAAGRLGQVVVGALHAAGHEVIATDQFYTRDLPVRVELLNLSDADGCYRLLEGSEVLVHLANHPGVNALKPQTGYLNNVTANVNVFQASFATGVRKIVYASSIQAISGVRFETGKDGAFPPSQLPYLPLDGQLPQNPGNLYGASKVAGENLLAYYAKFHGLSTVSIRFPALIRPSHAQWDQDRIRHDTSLDEGFAYLALPDAAQLVAAVVKANLPGYRAYLPASIGTTLSPMSIDEIIARYYPEIPQRELGQFDNLVNVGDITRDTGWIPKCNLYGR